MAQLKDTTINGNLKVDGVINLPTDKGVRGVHPTTGDMSSLIFMNPSGNTTVGYGGYVNKNGSTHLYGNDVSLYVGNANTSYRPYYKAGDGTVNVFTRTVGYCSNSGRYIRFTVPLSKPVIGNPIVTPTSNKGIMLFQDGKYTHDSGSGIYVSTGITYTATIENGCVAVTAIMPTTTDAVTLETIGIVWSGTLTFS